MSAIKFDVIVIGAGSGLDIADRTSSKGLKTAVVECGPMGGTCLNRGCIPSKILIHRADIAESIKRAHEFGLTIGKPKVNFKAIVEETSKEVDRDSKSIERALKEGDNPKLFKGVGKFISKKTLVVNGKTITADKIFILAGTRPFVPPIKGLDKVNYLTSTEALRLKKLPKSITFVGGGYISAELGHFFGALGSNVNIIQKDNLLVSREDEDIAKQFTKQFSKKYNVFLGYEVAEVQKKSKGILVKMKKSKGNGSVRSLTTDQIVVTTGRTPNSDVLEVTKSGIKTNKRGYIETNDFLETNVKGVWAAGDIAGKYLFKHSANLEASYASRNAFSEKPIKVDYYAMPHAVFSSPQIAGVGMTEEETKEKKLPYVVGKYEYENTGMGTAFKEKNGFVKFIVEKVTGRILGCHIIGPEASTLIHEVLVAMKSGDGTIKNITGTVHIHPALSEVVQRAAFQVRF
jgi:mycothione reductase